MNDRDWVAELSRYLQNSFIRLCDQAGQSSGVSELRVNPPLTIAEAKFFLLGMEEGVFRIDDEGKIRSDMNPTWRCDSLQIFSVDSQPPRLVREGICLLATVSSLILQRGWLPDQIEMREEAAAFGVDVIVKSATGEIYSGIEAKRSVHELQKLANDFRQCCRRGAHAKADCAFQQNHSLFEFCERYRPNYFWTVAPAGELCLRLNYKSEFITLDELETLPPRSHIEFNAG